MTRRAVYLWLALALLVPRGAAVVFVMRAQSVPEDRVYTIGWEVDPPVQVATEGGEPSGPAIEIVRQAARRRGIRLRWLRCVESSESSLRNGRVDLWPLMTVTEERRKHLHLTDPYQQIAHLFLVLSSSGLAKTEDLSTARVGLDPVPFTLRLLQEHYPRVRPAPTPSIRAAIESLCRGEIDAVFVDQSAAFAVLLEGAQCPGQPLRLVSDRSIPSMLAVGSTFESRKAADAIREEIGRMSDDGTIAAIIFRWGYGSAQGLESITSLLAANRSIRTYRIGAGGLMLLLTLAIGLAIGYRRERNRALALDRARREAEQNLRLVADNLNEMVLAFDMRRMLTYANPGLGRLTGYSADEIRREGFICWIHPGDRSRMLSFWDRLFEGTSFEQEEYRLITKDGREKWASATWGPIFDASGKQVGVRGSERDITERRLAEMALQKSEQRYRDVALSTADLVFEIDADLRVSYTSERLVDFLGYRPEELAGRRLLDLCDPAEVAGVEERFARATTERHALRDFEHSLRHKDGHYLSVVSSAVPTLGPEDRLLGYRGVSRDVTSGKLAERERNRLAEQLQQAQKMEAIGRLAGGVAHDFNNLLTVINGYSNLLGEKFGDREPERLWVQEISGAGDRASRLVRQLLAFSRKQMLEPRILSVNELIGNLETMLVRLVGEDIEIQTRLGSKVGAVRADRNQLEQVILNLVVNARDAMPKGGTLTLETDHARLGALCPGCGTSVSAGEYVVLIVKDTGSGIDEETRRRIFEPFFTTKAVDEGSGLGLSIVHGIVTQSGGHIDVESAAGRGTVFRIHLPRAEEEAEVRETVAPAVVSGGSETILLVEDQEDVRRFAASTLRSAGYSVIEAGDGEEALTLCIEDQRPIDLLLTDVVMPRMNGRELAVRLRDHRPQTKVLFISGYLSDVLEGRGLGGEMIDFIQKPFLPRELLAKVEAVLSLPVPRHDAGHGGSVDIPADSR